MNPIKKLPKVIKTERLEMRQLNATPENAKLVFDAVKNENPDNFYFNPIAKNAVPKTSKEMLKKMQQEDEYSKSNGANYYIFHNDKLIGYRRFHFFDDATKTLQMSIVWLVRSEWGKGFAKETSDKIEEISSSRVPALSQAKISRSLLFVGTSRVSGR